MAKRKVNVALIGAQFMGKAHSKAWQEVGMMFDPPVEPVLKVFCRRTDDPSLAEKYGWEEFSTDWREVVARDDIDVVDVSTPNKLHPVISIEAAKNGKHVFCEKPLANTLSEAQDALSAVRDAGVKHLASFTYRFAPAIQTIKALIDNGALGRIFHFRAAYQQDWIVDPEFPLVWRLKKEDAGSGALGDLGAHMTDLCHFLVGPISEVTSTMQTFVKERPIGESDTGISGTKSAGGGEMGAVDVDDATAYIARIQGQETIATFEVTRFCPGRRNHNTIEIYGSEGSVIWDLEEMNYFQYYNRNDPENLAGFRKVHATDPAHPFMEGWWPPGHIIGYGDLFVHACYEFLNGLDDGGAATYPTFEDAVACQRVLEAVIEAAATKKWEPVT